jgi:hypothetical protein
MPFLANLHQLFDTQTCQAYTIIYAGKIGPCNAPDVRATTSAPGGRITTSPD